LVWSLKLRPWGLIYCKLILIWFKTIHLIKLA
jgi:hypothetical protein